MMSTSTTVPSYSESLRIGWTLLWRGTGSFMILLTLCDIFIVIGPPELVSSVPSFWASLLPLVIGTAVATFGIMPIVVRLLFTGSYSNFRLQLVRTVLPAVDDTKISYDSSKVTSNFNSFKEV